MTTMVRKLVAVATFSGLAGAVIVSLAWVLVADGQGRLEPATQTLGLLAALTGIVAERLTAERQRRRLAMTALVDELVKNRAILGDLLFTLGRTDSTRRRVYPRLLGSATDGIIASGALTGGAGELFTRLHEWRNEVADFNRRLDLTEMLTFLQGTPEAISRFERALSRDDGRVYRISQLLQEFLDYLAEHHRGDLRRPAGRDWAALVTPPAQPVSPVLVPPPRPPDRQATAGPPNRHAADEPPVSVAN